MWRTGCRGIASRQGNTQPRGEKTLYSLWDQIFMMRVFKSLCGLHESKTKANDGQVTANVQKQFSHLFLLQIALYTAVNLFQL